MTSHRNNYLYWLCISRILLQLVDSASAKILPILKSREKWRRSREIAYRVFSDCSVIVAVVLFFIEKLAEAIREQERDLNPSLGNLYAAIHIARNA